MGVYVRPDSPFYWLLLEGHRDAKGSPRREATAIRRDAPTPALRRDAKAAAEQLYHARMIALARGTLDPEAGPTVTFAEHLDWFLRHRLPQRRGRAREAEILPRFRAAFGTLELRAIDQARVQEWITQRLATPTVLRQGRHVRTIRPSPATVNREVDTLKAVLQAGVPKHFPVSPLRGMPRLRTTTPKRRILTPAEETRLLAELAPDDTALFLLALDSLVRLSDVLDLRWADDHGRTIYVADPKAGGGFEVPISSRARLALDAIKPRRLDGSQYIFARRRRGKTEAARRNAVKQLLQQACRRAKVPYGRTRGGVTFHWATRRTGTTRMLTRQVDIGTVQKVGRWKTPAVVLGVYHDLVDDAARAAVEAVGPRDSGVDAKLGKTRKPSATRGQARKRKRPDR